MLAKLPPPKYKVAIGAYQMEDKSGQHKPNDSFAEYSRAVTQAGYPILVDVLKSAGNGSWFRVLERQGLNNILKERKIIEVNRQKYTGQKKVKLLPLKFAELIIEGAVTGYDSNEQTGGVGARYLGIGGDKQYRKDVVTVALRLVDVYSGEIHASVSTTKTVYSVLVKASTFKFVSLNKLLEIEAGLSRNEPPSLAVRHAMQLATYSLILEGAKRKLWRFADRREGRNLIDEYEDKYKGITGL